MKVTTIITAVLAGARTSCRMSCEVRNLDVCGGDEGWVVDDFTLDVCAFVP